MSLHSIEFDDGQRSLELIYQTKPGLILLEFTNLTNS